MPNSAERSRLFHPLANEAIARMNDYQLVDSLVHERAEGQDMLGLDELAIAGGVLVPLQSGLLAPDALFESDLHIDTDNHQLVRQMGFKAMTAFADLVGLWPEGNRGAGEAALYRVRVPVEPVTLAYARPFQDAAREIIEQQEGLSLGFSHTSYKPVEGTAGNQEELVYGLRYQRANDVLATPESELHADTVETGEATNGPAVRVTLTGPARVALQRRHFARLTAGNLYTTPDNEDAIALLDIPADYEWSPDINPAHIMGNNTLVVHDRGIIFSEDNMPAPGEAVRHRGFNPRISDADLFKLATDLPYEDVTHLLLDRYPGDLNGGLPTDQAAPAHALLARGKAAIEARMQQSPYPQNSVGCLAIAALLREGLPAVGEGFRVDPNGSTGIFRRGQ